ncbi:pentatricopeptide repeat-containing protein At2g22410, mitochondrial-like [Glycine soja]|uniref:pentatricopeptide repeat-containing protein At2g22410, mitochondrial n=1 Tax=Glycine max TaxID=3847 RepID=UPI000E21BA68|nr:pentatricopeptide repeat-containing protein At2g22410, mitochondrial [Glycine max]XP_028203670.1 pentatricopeptide repeat-containing protein At2g22410, mitochondrial-like [Glycine soja]|eukprot:XP_025985543.1 pentatricopeptide repeat-containing protein At2g22410, mitochondrial-like [Glycine max]
MFVNKVRFRYPLKIPFLSVLCCLHARSLPPYVKAINWNTSHNFVQNNPLLSLLERCKSLDQLKQIQAQTVLTGLVNDGFAMSCLVAFCALLESGYVESEDLEGAGLLYKRMLRCGVLKPDNLTYPLLIKDCSCPSMNCVGFTVLGHVLRLGFEFDIFVHNASITMLLLYVELEAAYDVFNKGCVRDLVTWNAMITGCVRRGLANEAKKLYREMEAEKVKPNEITMIGIVSACSQLQDLNLGREFHDYLKEHGLELTIPLNNSLIDMHLKCGDLLAAWILFLGVAPELLHTIPEKSVVPWNAIISGCVQAKNGKDTFDLFNEMQIRKIDPDNVTSTV